MFFLLIISVSVFGCYNNYDLPTTFYGFNFIIILIYYTIKLVVISILFSVISVFIYSLFRNVGIVLYSIILIFCTLINNFQEGVIISEITQFPINYIDYLSLNQYANIIYDVMAFVFS